VLYNRETNQLSSTTGTTQNRNRQLINNQHDATKMITGITS
jgi:hypothetical protein